LSKQATLASFIKGAQDSITSLGLSGEILIADNGLIDGST
jgi:hypothetical protein